MYVHFKVFEDIENQIYDFIAPKDDSFFTIGIRKLPERWRKVGRIAMENILMIKWSSVFS